MQIPNHELENLKNKILTGKTIRLEREYGGLVIDNHGNVLPIFRLRIYVNNELTYVEFIENKIGNIENELYSFCKTMAIKEITANYSVNEEDLKEIEGNIYFEVNGRKYRCTFANHIELQYPHRRRLTLVTEFFKPHIYEL